jgi:hypothetical protein
MNTRTAVLASLLAASSFASLAQGVFQHPAVSTPPQAASVDPSTFIVGHPASPTWQVRHANAEHPAIAMRAEATRSLIDPNTFVVQPPAHAEWTQLGAAGTQGAVALVRFN